jgi:NitT/TauT family transport system substrate-binding protein
MIARLASTGITVSIVFLFQSAFSFSNLNPPPGLPAQPKHLAASPGSDPPKGPSASYAAIKVVYAIPGKSVGYLPIFVAKDQGFFRDENVEINIHIAKTQVALSGQLAGQIDYNGFAAANVRLAAQGLVKLVGCYYNRSTQYLITAPSYPKVESLRGVTAAIQTPRSTSEKSLALALGTAGLKLSDVNVLYMGDQDQRAALIAGSIKAAIRNPEEVPSLRKLGFHIPVALSSLLKEPFSCIGATTEKLQKQPEEVKRFLRPQIRALRYITGNQQGTIEIISREWAIDRDSAKEVLDLILPAIDAKSLGIPSPEGLRAMVDQEREYQNLRADLSVDDVWDLSILRSIHKDLGLSNP